MKSSPFLAALLLSLGLSTAAVAQTTTPTSTTNSPNGATTTDKAPIGRAADGSNIGNNRDRLSTGTGTPATSAIDRQARKEQKEARRAAKGKTKSKP